MNDAQVDAYKNYAQAYHSVAEPGRLGLVLAAVGDRPTVQDSFLECALKVKRLIKCIHTLCEVGRES